MITEIRTVMRELNSRVNDDIRVRLIWCERDDQTFVVVTDHRGGEVFSLQVGEGESALDVFHHPYAYAAWHGIDVHPPSVIAEPAVAVGV
jgi:hypothetical protein